MSRKNSVFRRINDLSYGYTNSFHLFDVTKNSRDIVQRLRLQMKIPAHNGCVNSICWNESGKYLLSGSDDQHLCVTDGYSHTILSYVQTGHRANIFSAKFLPSAADHKVISCSGDGIIIYSDLEIPETSMQNKFNCHFGTAYEIMTVPSDPNTFLSCGEDGMVRWFDLRTKTSCSKENCKEDILINCRCAVTSLAINPVTPYQLAVGCADASVRIFDRRMLGTHATGSFAGKGAFAMIANFTTPQFTHSHRITSLGYSHDGQELLVSYSSDFVYLFDLRNSLRNDSKRLTVPETGSSKKGGRNVYTPSRPMMKRLRVRGDWSDTGPHARPECESRGDHHPRTLHANLMQRMSDVLTSMYNHRSRNQQNPSNTSSSSHSEESETEEAEENETPGGNRAPRKEKVCSCSPDPPNQPEVPENQSENNVAEATVDNREEENDSLQKPSSSHTNFPPSDGVDLSCTTIEVKPSTSPEGSSNTLEAESQASETKVLNLSLQNLKHEMAMQKELSDMDLTQSVISDVMAMDASSDSSENRASETAPVPSSTVAEGPSENISENESATVVESTNDNCDKPDILNCASTSNSAAVAASAEPNSVSDNEAQSSSNVSCDSIAEAIPDIFVASVSAAAGDSETRRERQDSSHDEGEMALMMEVDTWDIESGEDTRSPPSSPSVFDRSESVVAALKDFSEDDLLRHMEDRNSPIALTQPDVIRKFMGHRNARTMIKESTFWGDDFVMSGSDCGHIFIWDRHTAELVMLMEADHHVVNCLQPHPFDPILASSGIDYDIKIWAPLREEPFFDEELANEIIKRNKVMLEETKDTITVPASFMIRMLASLNHITSGSGWRRVARQLRDENRSRSNR